MKPTRTIPFAALLAALCSAGFAASIHAADPTVTAPFRYVEAKAYHVLPGTHNNESGYFSLSESLDGRIHVGTTKYGENAFLVEFDPRTERQRIVLDAHEALGLKSTGYAAQAKIHTRNFVGPSGRVYVGTKQGYPTDEDKKNHVAYPGGYVLVYDPRTGAVESHGMPYQEQGVADVVADERRDLYYIVTCEDQHWMRYDAAAKTYRELGPLLTPYATTLMDSRGRAHAITKDFELATFDPESDRVAVRPILVDGKRWTRANDAAIPTWRLAADGRTAYLILMNDATLLAVDLGGDGEHVAATSRGKMIDGKNPDSRSALDIGPDGNVYAVVRVDNDTGFGKGYLHHLLRFDPRTRTSQDLGVLKVSNPDFFKFGPGPDGKNPPWSHGYHTLPDGALTPLYHHMALIVARDGTIYITVIAPFTLLKVEAVKPPVAAATPAERYIDEALKACDRIEADLPRITATAETIADRVLRGGQIGFPQIRQTLGVELWGRSGGIMHVGFDRSWKPSRTDAEKSLDILIAGWDGAPDGGDLGAVDREQKRGCLFVGFGPKDLPRLAEHVRAADVWFDSGLGPEDSVDLGGGRRAGKLNHLVNAVHGWVLTSEVVAALTRRGRMPAMWKSWYYHDGREWSDRYFRKTGFHDEFKVPPAAAGALASEYLDRIRYLLRRFANTQLDGVRAAADLVAAEHLAGRDTIVASSGHMSMYCVGRYDDSAWAANHEVHAFVGPQMKSYAEKTPDGALAVCLSESGLHRDLAALFRDKGQRVVLIAAPNPYPETRVPGDGYLLHIDMGYAFGDACVPVEGYPVRILPASGVMQAAAYQCLNVEVQARIGR
jgi:hypothetical protein